MYNAVKLQFSATNIIIQLLLDSAVHYRVILDKDSQLMYRYIMLLKMLPIQNEQNIRFKISFIRIITQHYEVHNDHNEITEE